MRTTYLPLLLVALLATGCTQTRMVGTDDSVDYTFEELHQSLEGRTVDIQLHDERLIPSMALLIGPDTTWALDELTGEVRGSATGEIAAIRYNRPGRAAVHGALIGAAAGSLFGLLSGFGLTSVRDEDTATTSVAYYVAVPTAFFGVVGFGAGTYLGLRRGSYDQYVYPQAFFGDEAPAPPALPSRAEARNLDGN